MGECMNSTIKHKQKFPSPHPGIELSIVTYDVNGLHVKGLLAEPKDGEAYDGFLYLRGGIKNVGMVRPGRIVQFASEGFIVFAPFYRGNEGEKETKILLVRIEKMRLQGLNYCLQW